MILADIDVALFIAWVLAVVWLGLRRLYAAIKRSRAQRRRMADPTTHGDEGGWPASGWPGS